MPASRFPLPPASPCCSSSFWKKPARQRTKHPTNDRGSRRTGHRTCAVDRGRMAVGHRALRHRHQPQLPAPDRLPRRGAVRHLCAVAGSRLSLGRRSANLLLPSAGNAGRGSRRAGAGAHRPRRRCDDLCAAARVGTATSQADRHTRPRGAAADATARPHIGAPNDPAAQK